MAQGVPPPQIFNRDQRTVRGGGTLRRRNVECLYSVCSYNASWKHHWCFENSNCRLYYLQLFLSFNSWCNDELLALANRLDIQGVQKQTPSWWGGWKNFTLTRHKFLLVTVKEWLESVLNYRSYPINKIGYPFFGPPCVFQVHHCGARMWPQRVAIGPPD